MHRIEYTFSARVDLRKLEKIHAKRIIGKIAFWAEQKNPLKFAKRLNNSSLGTYRFSVGDYRIIFDCDHRGNILILMILRIKHRKDVYDL